MSSNRTARYIMILGTQSHAGKSVIVTALCRILKRRGYRVAPFKSQNMSLNSWITKDGKEIGIAQAVQAFAAGVDPTADMNPVLLKPKGGITSQVVLLGRPLGDRKAGEYYASTNGMMAVAKGALDRLSKLYDIIVMEGAGGAAEINLYDSDIANSRIAKAVGAPIILVGDIERGGVFAGLYGTLKLLPEEDRRLVKGFIINKFRGDVSLLKSGIDELERITGIPVLGVIPYSDLRIPSEDSLSIEDKKVRGHLDIDIAVIRFSFISNFTDFEPLERLAQVRYVPLDGELGKPDIVILPGTKNTVNDLKELNNSPLGYKIKKMAVKGTPVIGICGGFQMLGDRIIDHGIEGGGEESVNGLGLLPATTFFDKYEKITCQVAKRVTAGGPILSGIKGSTVKGYEIHMGKTLTDRPTFEDDGGISESGTIIGTYLHGIFANDNFTKSLLEYACRMKGVPFDPPIMEDDPYDELANLVEASVDTDRIISIVNSGSALPDH
jgi:adenosylcobyric acid synthase